MEIHGLGFQRATCREGALQGGEEGAPPAVCVPPFQGGAFPEVTARLLKPTCKMFAVFYKQ